MAIKLVVSSEFSDKERAKLLKDLKARDKAIFKAGWEASSQWKGMYENFNDCWKDYYASTTKKK